MKIHFIRHGESEANQSRTIIQGQLDSPLTEKGQFQAQELGEQIDFGIDTVYSSPLTRAKQTAIIALKAINWNIDRIRYEDDLKEIGMGSYEGLTFEEIGFPKELFRPIVFLEHDVQLDKHNGESVIDFKKRTVKIFHKIVDNAIFEGHSSVVIFSHGGVMRSILNHHLQLYDGKYYNTEIISIQQINGKWELIEQK